MTAESTRIGVVNVSFHSGAFIDECLESLFAAKGADLRVVVVDNNSSDATPSAILDWASGAAPYRRRPDSPLPEAAVVAKPIACVEASTDAPPPLPGPLTLLRSPINGGYAYGVNQGLKLLLADPEIDLFWVLNPDCVSPAETPAAIAAASKGETFSLLGGRAIYYERPGEIQTDGGRVSRTTGRCESLHSGQPAATTPMPDAAKLDYISGANVIVSRAFIQAAGLMVEDYFLYCEEVDWALRRGNLPIRLSPDVIVFHRGGTAIGSGDTKRLATPFSLYFRFRNQMRLVARFMPSRAPITVVYALAKAAQLALKGYPEGAHAVIAGIFSLTPPRSVSAKLTDPVARALAFGKPQHGA